MALIDCVNTTFKNLKYRVLLPRLAHYGLTHEVTVDELLEMAIAAEHYANLVGVCDPTFKHYVEQFADFMYMAELLESILTKQKGG